MCSSLVEQGYQLIKQAVAAMSDDRLAADREFVDPCQANMALVDYCDHYLRQTEDGKPKRVLANISLCNDIY